MREAIKSNRFKLGTIYIKILNNDSYYMVIYLKTVKIKHLKRLPFMVKPVILKVLFITVSISVNYMWLI